MPIFEATNFVPVVTLAIGLCALVPDDRFASIRGDGAACEFGAVEQEGRRVTLLTRQVKLRFRGGLAFEGRFEIP